MDGVHIIYMFKLKKNIHKTHFIFRYSYELQEKENSITQYGRTCFHQRMNCGYIIKWVVVHLVLATSLYHNSFIQVFHTCYRGYILE